MSVSSASVPGVRVSGICACVPSREIDNATYCASLFGDDIDGAIKTTGAERRRVCTEGKTTSLDLCRTAAEALLSASATERASIGAIIFVTQTPDFLLPNNSTHIQTLLDIPASVAAFDVNLACSGYPYGLWVAGMCARSLGKKVLLLDGDTHSHFVSRFDKTTALLFGDAGTATLIEASDDEGAPWVFSFDTDGTHHEALKIPAGGYRNRVTRECMEYAERADGGRRREIDMRMDGMDVFSFVVRNVPDNITQVLAASSNAPGAVDYLVLHQANRFMIRQIAKKLGFPPEKVPVSIHKYGNSSSATIPVTLCSELHRTLEQEEKNYVLSGFGAGLSIASVSLTMGPCVCPGVVEYVE